MAIQGIEQPAVIQIDESLRLRKFDGVYDFALEWYQDEEVVWLVDGEKDTYDTEQLSRMYNYLNDAGDLYFIEVMENGTYKPIGAVTFRQDDMPIVIGDPDCRGKKIGRKVVSALIHRGSELGYGDLAVGEIYDWNEASRRCFEILAERYMMVEFRKFTEFPRGTLYDILQDAYSYDSRNKELWDANWHESDDFFYDNPEIADKYGLVTCIGDYPIGFVTWDPRHIPEYVEIGHNGIRSEYKRKGYGHLQLQEAIRRIQSYDGLKRIIVWTNSNLVAPKNYESCGFKLYDRKKNDSESAYTGDYLYYEIIL